MVSRTNQIFANDRTSAYVELLRVRNPPSDVRCIPRHTTEHLAIEVFHDFWTTLVPPHRGGRDELSVPEGQGVRKLWIGIRQRFVVVGMVERRLVCGGRWTEDLDPELLHHVRMVGSRRGRVWIERLAGGRLLSERANREHNGDRGPETARPVSP